MIQSLSHSQHVENLAKTEVCPHPQPENKRTVPPVCTVCLSPRFFVLIHFASFNHLCVPLCLPVAAANGLEVVSDSRWASENLRGFWRVGTMELMTRREPGETYMQGWVTGLKRVSGSNYAESLC